MFFFWVFYTIYLNFDLITYSFIIYLLILYIKNMNIYIAHSSNYNFINELYNPIKKSQLLNKHTFIFPHENDKSNINSKDIIKKCNLLISEVSLPSTWLWIELWWANTVGCPIIFIYKKWTNFSSSLKLLSDNFFEYSNEKELIKIINNFLSHSNI